MYRVSLCGWIFTDAGPVVLKVVCSELMSLLSQRYCIALHTETHFSAESIDPPPFHLFPCKPNCCSTLSQSRQKDVHGISVLPAPGVHAGTAVISLQVEA